MVTLEAGSEVKDDTDEEEEEEILSDKNNSLFRNNISLTSIATGTKILLSLLLVLILLIIMLVVVMRVIGEAEEKYPTYQEILEQLEKEVERLEPYIDIKTQIIGKSVENRNITLIKMFPKSDNTLNTTGRHCNHPLVWIVCGVHAREWTSPLTCLSFINRIGDIMVNNSSSVHSSDAFLRIFQYNILVLANPDGYHYSMSEESLRLTRKNRKNSSCPDSTLQGVDINRNFGAGYNHGDDCYGQACPFNATPCSITHGGLKPFSEPETRAVRDAMMEEVPWLSISLHGNGNSWSSPFAYKTTDPSSVVRPEWDLKYLAEKLEKEFGTEYLYGSSANVMYLSGGTMIDWVYEELGVVRSYNHELRNLCKGKLSTIPVRFDRGLCIFQPKVQVAREMILPEAWLGFKELLKHSYHYDCVSI